MNVTMEWARNNFADLMHDARYANETVIITKYGKPFIEIKVTRASRIMDGTEKSERPQVVNGFDHNVLP